MEKMVGYLRQALPYIHEHRNKTIIVLLRGSIVSNLSIPSLIQDWALLQNLNIRLIIIPWFEAIEPKTKVEAEYYHEITRETTQLWSDVSRHCAQHQVFIANGTFTIARPRGIIDGIDCQFRGQIQHIHTDKLKSLLDTEQHVWLPPFSFSTRGEPLLLEADQFASAIANELNIEKLFIVADQQELPELASPQQHISQLSVSEHPFFQFAHDATSHLQSLKRIYLVDVNVDGSMLLELYTRDGCGMLLYSDHYDLIRPATLDDLDSIQRLTHVYSDQAILIERQAQDIADHISQYHLMLRDDTAVGCYRINDWDEDAMEIASLAIADDAKGLKLGSRLLQHAEQLTLSNQKKLLFALTTQTTDWFLNRGFSPCSIEIMPSSKQITYDAQRQSNILCKLLK